MHPIPPWQALHPGARITVALGGHHDSRAVPLIAMQASQIEHPTSVFLHAEWSGSDRTSPLFQISCLMHSPKMAYPRDEANGLLILVAPGCLVCLAARAGFTTALFPLGLGTPLDAGQGGRGSLAGGDYLAPKGRKRVHPLRLQKCCIKPDIILIECLMHEQLILQHNRRLDPPRHDPLPESLARRGRGVFSSLPSNTKPWAMATL